MIHLLNSFLPLATPIVSIEYMPEELHDDLLEGRLGIVDVRCQDAVGRQFIVEMQIRKTPLLMQRLVWNAARILSRQLDRGGPFKGIQPVFTLCLLDHEWISSDPEWVHNYAIRSDTTAALVPDGLFFTIVEFKKWVEKGTFEKSDDRDGWMLFFTKPEAMMEVYTPEERQELRDLFSAVNAWDLTRHTANELWIMDKKIDVMLTHEYYAEWYFNQGKDEGVKHGIEQVRKLGMAVIIAVSHKINAYPGITDVQLQSAFGISAEEVSLIRAML